MSSGGLVRVCLHLLESFVSWGIFPNSAEGTPSCALLGQNPCPVSGEFQDTDLCLDKDCKILSQMRTLKELFTHKSILCHYLHYLFTQLGCHVKQSWHILISGKHKLGMKKDEMHLLWLFVMAFGKDVLTHIFINVFFYFRSVGESYFEK